MPPAPWWPASPASWPRSATLPIPDGTTQQLEECFGGSWGGVKDRIRFAVTGNHDIHTDGGEPLQAYMGSAAARDGRTWFSEDLGTWHVVVLDSNCGFLGDLCGSESDQVRWLREDLAASGARCTLALMHQPRFSSGQHGDSQAVRSFWDELYAADAELVLGGHDHDYERFAPQAPDGTPDEARGVVEIVVGTGGADLEGFKEARPNSLVRDRRRARGARTHAWRGFVVVPLRRCRWRGARRGRRELPLSRREWDGTP